MREGTRLSDLALAPVIYFRVYKEIPGFGPRDVASSGTRLVRSHQASNLSTVFHCSVAWARGGMDTCSCDFCSLLRGMSRCPGRAPCFWPCSACSVFLGIAPCAASHFRFGGCKAEMLTTTFQ